MPIQARTQRCRKAAGASALWLAIPAVTVRDRREASWRLTACAVVQQTPNGSHRVSPGSSERSKPKKTNADFKTVRNIGEGAFGQVRLAMDLETGQEVAIKVLDKKHIIKEKKVEWVEREKCILDKLRHPSIVTLFYTYQDRDSLCTLALAVLTVQLSHSCIGFLHIPFSR